MKEKLQRYLDQYLHPKKERSIFKKICQSKAMECEELADYTVGSYAQDSIDAYIQDNQKKETFQTKLFQLIDQKEKKDSDVYHKVDIDRRLFSKIRSNREYHPSKETVILLGLALELTEKEIEELLETAAYSLPYNTTYDLIIRFCFKEKIYDIQQINEFLYDHNCKLLNEKE